MTTPNPIVGGHRRNNKPREFAGRRYASVMEARYAERLELERRAGIVRSWQPQFRIALEIPDVAGGPAIHVAFYIVDFDVHYANGRRELVETKGFWTDVAKLKRRVFEATWLRAHPDVTFRVITKVGTFGAATDEPAPARARPVPRQKSMSAQELRDLFPARGAKA